MNGQAQSPATGAVTHRVVATDYTFPDLDAERDAAAKAGAAFEAHRASTPEEIAGRIAGADVVLVQFAPVGAAAIAGLKPGARIVRYGVGFDNIDVAAANRQEVGVAYVPDYCIDEVADHTATLILTMLRKVEPLDGSVRAGKWAAVATAKPLPAFAETTIGFVGLGRIGRAVLARLKPFGFRFMAYDPAFTGDGEDFTSAPDLATLLRSSDCVSLHAPSTPATRNLINAETLALMRPTAHLVNTSRGDLIDEPALARALEDGRIAGAALDVFGQEPLPADSPLRSAPRLLLTPHVAWYSDTAVRGLQNHVADEITRALSGAPPRQPVPGSAPAR